MKHDPDDAIQYQLISPKAVIGKARKYLESGDVGVLMVPLENGRLELLFKGHQLTSPAAAAAAASGNGSLHSGLPAVTPHFGAASKGDSSSGDAHAHEQQHMSSSTGASKGYSRISREKSKQRRKTAGVDPAPNAAPSSVGRGWQVARAAVR